MSLNLYKYDLKLQSLAWVKCPITMLYISTSLGLSAYIGVLQRISIHSNELDVTKGK